MRLLAALALLLGACAGPQQVIGERAVVQKVAARYRAFYPAAGDPDVGRDAGLLRPRFGLPAVAQAGAAFPVEVLERGGPQALRAALLSPGLGDEAARRCLAEAAPEGPTPPPPGCHPLALSTASREAVAGGVLVHLQARPTTAPPPGGYDLYLRSPGDAPTRAPRAVWLRQEDPDSLPAVRVAHLSDLHIGKGPEHGALFVDRLRQVIRDVNAERPDLVIITGDIVNRGQDPQLAPLARSLLSEVDAPVLAVLGNHDIEFSMNPFRRRRTYELGWPHFARAFHPFLHFSVQLGGYDFVGFDSGPTEASPRVLTGGLLPASLAQLRQDVDGARLAGRRGVVLFSHAPSRARLAGGGPAGAAGLFGRMSRGRAEFERILLDAAARGQRVLHLAGHTHWSDLFEARPDGRRGLAFARWRRLPAEPTPIAGPAAIVTAQSASHSGIAGKESARGYGFASLLLGDGAPQVAFHSYGRRPARHLRN